MKVQTGNFIGALTTTLNPLSQGGGEPTGKGSDHYGPPPNENGGLQNLSSKGVVKPPQSRRRENPEGTYPIALASPTPSTKVEEVRIKTPIEKSRAQSRAQKPALF